MTILFVGNKPCEEVFIEAKPESLLSLVLERIGVDLDIFESNEEIKSLVIRDMVDSYAKIVSELFPEYEHISVIGSSVTHSNIINIFVNAY